jgi:hypothetical protein
VVTTLTARLMVTLLPLFSAPLMDHWPWWGFQASNCPDGETVHGPELVDGEADDVGRVRAEATPVAPIGNTSTPCARNTLGGFRPGPAWTIVTTSGRVPRCP